MTFPGDRNVKNLRALHAEMRITLQHIDGDPIMIVESSQRNGKVLKRQILELVDQIYNGTEDKHLKAVINSVFDTISVVDTIAELRGLNEGKRSLNGLSILMTRMYKKIGSILIPPTPQG